MMTLLSNPQLISEIGIQQIKRNEMALYKRARLKDRVSGKRREVVLINPHEIEAENNKGVYTYSPHSFLLSKATVFKEAFQYDAQYELKADIHKVLSEFTLVERRIIIRVFAQGMSVEQATQRMKKSTEKWRKWLGKEALPRLQKRLADYQEGGKVVF